MPKSKVTDQRTIKIYTIRKNGEAKHSTSSLSEAEGYFESRCLHTGDGEPMPVLEVATATLGEARRVPRKGPTPTDKHNAKINARYKKQEFWIPEAMMERGDAIADWIFDVINNSVVVTEGFEVHADVCTPNFSPIEQKNGKLRPPTDAERHAIAIDFDPPTLKFDLRKTSIDMLVEEFQTLAATFIAMAHELKKNAKEFTAEFCELPAGA